MGVLLMVCDLPWSLRDVAQMRTLSRADGAVTFTSPGRGLLSREGRLPSLGDSSCGICPGEPPLLCYYCAPRQVSVVWASFPPFSPLNSDTPSALLDSHKVRTSELYGPPQAPAFPTDSKDKGPADPLGAGTSIWAEGPCRC